MKKKRWWGVLLSLLMVFSALFSSVNTTVFAEGAPREVQATVKNLTIKNLSGQTTDKVFWTDKFYLDMDWDASSNGATLKQGDYFDITLPNEMKFPAGSTESDFNIYGADGHTVIAKAHVTPGPGDKGGKVRVTFEKWVEGKENVKGHIRLTSQFDRDIVKKDEKNTFNITVNGKVTPTTVEVVGPKKLPSDEMLAKWGQAGSNANEAEWWVRFNYQKAKLTNAVISDHLTGGAGTETYIPGSFRLRRVDYNNLGDDSHYYGDVDLTGKLQIAADGKSFTINLGQVNGEQYRLIYKTTYTPGTRLINNVKLSSDQKTTETHGSHISSTSGGSGTGNLANKIKLIKVDAENNTTPLANATFEVTRPDGTKFDLTTGADGTVTSDRLTSGTYKAKEKTAPAGYQLNGEEYTLNVNPSGGAIQTIKDTPIKTTVKVDKKWVGKKGTSATVHLYADNADTGKSATLNEANQWTYTFTDLRQYTPAGKEIKYTIKEDTIPNYQSEVTGDMASGYTVKNTNTEKISVPVTKTWVGKPAASATVKLLADGAVKDTATLTKDGGWKHTFENLPKYDANDGHEIAYTLDEVKVDGYTTAVSGNAKDGFTVTNTITGKVSVPVTKTWVGKAADSVKVHLYADGVEKDSVTLNEGNHWQHTFADLDKYKDGVEIQYTVKEDPIANYQSEITGDMTAGYTVKNTNTEKISVPVTKTWVGKPAASATVKLLADGAVKDTATLTKDGGWKHTFENLPKYDANDGHEIAYTLDEVKVDGYTTAVSGSAKDGFTVTNTITGKVSVPVTKTWVGKAADSVKVHLYADGVEKDSVTLSEGNHWQHTFAGLDKYKDGVEIQYTIKEDPIENYQSEITGDMTAGYTVKNTNTEKISVPVTKTWVGKPAASATVKLLADGAVKDTATLTKDGGWKHTFENLPKYDANDGHEIVYTLDEVKVDGYITGMSGSAKDGFTVTNTITGKVSVPVTKTWVGKAGTSAKIRLYADGVEKDSVTLNEGNHWQHTFAGLDKYKDGVEIQYTIKEDPIANYQSEITGDMTAGYTVKNTNTEKVSVPVTKTWVGKPAASATVKLLADGTVKDTATLTKDGGWKHTFADLPKYDANDGHEIVYTLDEVKVDGYVTGISGTAENGFTVTNTITGKVSVPVTKKWIGSPVDHITVNLYADGQKIASQKLSKDNNWQYTFKDLDQYKDGQEIKYTIEEESVAGYATSISGDAANGFTITNTQDQPKTPPKAPKTGDLGGIPVYGSVLLLAAVLASGLIGKKRRQAK